MSRFTWVPQWSAECSEEPRVNKVSFGDGYEQRQTNGLNADLETWSVKFKEAPDTILQIKAFLQECGGVDTFLKECLNLGVKAVLNNNNSSGGSGGIVIQMTTNVYSDGSSSTESSSSSDDAQAKTVAEGLNSEFKAMLVEEMKPNGLLAKFASSK